jgi:hypothetical protein
MTERTKALNSMRRCLSSAPLLAAALMALTPFDARCMVTLTCSVK